MPQNDNAPKVMPDLAALGLADVIYYQRFFDRIGEMMNVAMAFDPASNPVAVIAPGCSPCIELTGLQWPSEAVLMGPNLGGDQLVWGRSNVNTVSGSGIGSPAPDASAVVSPPQSADAPVAGGVVPPASSLAQPPATGRKPANWTKEEDDLLVQIVASAHVCEGLSIRAGAARAAETLGRPLEGISFRLHNKMAQKLTAAIAMAKMRQDQPAPISAPTPPAASDQVIAALDWLQQLTADDATKPKKMTTPQQDYDLIRLSIDKVPVEQIAEKLGLHLGDCKLRLISLTRAQQYRLPDLMAAMAQMHPKLATGADDDAAA